MRNILFLMLMVAAIIVVCLYIGRINRVPTEVKQTLTTETGDTVSNMGRIPQAVRKKVGEAFETDAKKKEDALKDLEK